MTRFEFMSALEQLLSPLPDAERCDALRYYEEYFDAAGPEKEAEVIAELGSPEQLAKKLLEAQSLPTVPTPPAAANARSRQRSRAKWFALGGFAAAVLAFGLVSVLPSAKTGPIPLIQTPSTAVFTSQDTSKHEVESFQQSVSLEEIRDLELRLDFGSVVFQVDENATAATLDFQEFRRDWLLCQRQQDDDGYEYLIRYKVPANVDPHKWSNPVLTITLPPEALRSLDLYLAMGDADLGSLSVDDMDLELSMGDLSAKAVRSREFSADMAMGNIQLEQLRANEADFALSMGSLAIDSAAVQELDAEMDMGDLKIARLEGLREAELELSAGDLTLGLADAADSCRTNARCALGEVTVNGQSQGTRYQTSSGSAALSVQCSLGDIRLNFGV